MRTAVWGALAFGTPGGSANSGEGGGRGDGGGDGHGEDGE